MRLNIVKTLGSIAIFGLLYASIKFKEIFEPTEDYSNTKVLLTIIEKHTGNAICINLETLAEKSSGDGRYEFLQIDGKTLSLDLRDGSFRIIRRRVPL